MLFRYHTEGILRTPNICLPTHADNCALNLQQLKGYITTLMKYGSNFVTAALMQIPSNVQDMSGRSIPASNQPSDCTRWIILQVITVHAKICTLRKCNLVAMCNMMHFSTVSTSRLKHFQLTRLCRCLSSIAQSNRDALEISQCCLTHGGSRTA